MKESILIKKIQTLLPALALALLLLLSPCKVRNFIQSELGIPQTEVTNKSKSNLINSNCSDLEIADAILSKEITAFQHDFVFTAPVDFSFNNYNYSEKHLHLTVSRNHSVSRVPLYILYQNFKDYL